MGYLFYQTKKITKLRLGLFVLVLALASYATNSRADDAEAPLPVDPVSSENGGTDGGSAIDRKPGFSPVTAESSAYNGNYLDYATEAQLQVRLAPAAEASDSD